MGNCLVVQENVVKIMKTDGKVLEYKAPIKVEQVLVDFSGHAVSDSLLRHLQPNTKLLGGSLYYLVPPLPPPQKPSTPKSSKKVRFAEPEVQDVQESKVVTIKVVISKQQLRDMMQKGVVSVDKMLSMVHCENQGATDDDDDDDDDDEGNRDFCDNAWKPPLESITEVN